MRGYEGFEFVQLERSGRILIATMNRPERLNALGRSEHREVSALLRAVAHDDETDVLVLRGAGRAFCVGGDFDMVLNAIGDAKTTLQLQREARELVQAHVDLEKPVVAAVHGQLVAGAGASLALLSDIIVVERSTKIGDCHTLIGMVAGDGGVVTWPMSMGIARAKRYLMLGERIPAEVAAELGLITEVVDDGQSTPRAMEYAQRLAALSPAGVQLTKRALNSWLTLGLTTAFHQSLGAEMLTFLLPETADLIRKAGAPPSRRT